MPHGVHVVALLYINLVAWVLYLLAQGVLTQSWILDATPLLPAGAAVFLSLSLWRQQRNHGFFVLALGIGLVSVGDSVWTWYEGVLGRAPTTPGVADLGYGPAYLVIGVALLWLASSRPSQKSWVVFIESGLLCLIMALVVHAYFAATTTRIPVSSAERLINSLYLFGDGFWVFAALVLMGRTGLAWRTHRFYVLLGSSVVLWVLTDVLYTNHTLEETYFTGVWFDIGYTLSFTLTALALYHLRYPSAVTTVAQEAQRSEMTRVFVPYGIVIVTFLLLGVETWQEKSALRSILEAGLLALCLMVVLRQTLLLVENGKLTQALSRAGGELERTVRARTLQLERRTQQVLRFNTFTKQLASSLEEEVIWGIVITQARQILSEVEVVFEAVDDLSRGFIEQHQGGMAAPLDRLEIPIEGRTAQFAWLLVRKEQIQDEADRAILEEIASAIGMAISNARAYAAAREAADRDPMTQLLNHRAALEHLQKRLNQAREQGQAYSILMLDINNFKLFNDTYGHPVGDAVICLVAQALSGILPSDTVIGRYGGDEFVVGVEGLRRAELEALPEQINARLRHPADPLLSEVCAVPVTISCGAALFPEDGERPSELIAHADRALLDAKADGEVARTVRRPSPRLDLFPEEGNPFILSALDAMVTAVDNKDRYTRTHSEDVALFSDWLAEAIGLSTATRQSLRVAALLHDIGKIGIPDAILRKPSRLTPEEFEIMKQHTTLGALIIAGLPGGTALLPVVRSHHERWDGQGYPDALVGEEIPQLARIAAIADAFSAMTTSRPYRRERDWSAALAEIQSGAGSQFDPTLAALFVAAAARQLREKERIPRIA